MIALQVYPEPRNCHLKPKKSIVVCPTKVFGPSRPLQLTSVNFERARMCLCIVAVLRYVLF
jgi:hypothetical protein